MGRHTESYRLLVTDHVHGRQGVASDFTGWAEDPEAAIAAYRLALREQVDGTTVDLQRVEATSVMSTGVAAFRETTLRYAGKRAPEVSPTSVDDTDAAPVSPYAAHGYAARVELSPGMARVLVKAHQSGGRLHGELTGTVTSLIDRGLMGTVQRLGQAHHLTDRGRRMASFLAGSPELEPWIRTMTGNRRTLEVPQN